LRGWEYALAHPDEIIQLILTQYSVAPVPPHRAEQLHYEAVQIGALLRPDLVQLGYMNPGRWQSIAHTYADLGMSAKNFSLNGFLYDADPKPDYFILYRWIALFILIAALVSMLALYIFQVNRRLTRSLAEVKATSLRLKMLSMAIEHSPTSVVITDADSRIEYVNPQFTRETGYSAEEAFGQMPRMLQSGLTDMTTYSEMWRNLGEGKLWTGVLINRRKSGEIYWEEAHIAPVRDESGKTTHYIGVKLDITERKLHADRLTHMAHHDSLTNLPNRILFFERVAQGIHLARRNRAQLALMYIDLDKFKPINDTYGHAVGDAILLHSARRMTEALRAADTVGRIGGDEFVALLQDIGNLDNAAALANKIRAAMNEPFHIEERTYRLSVSIGVAVFPEHGNDELSLAQSADMAMYRAKASGRNAIQMYDRRMAPQAAVGESVAAPD